MNHISSLSRSIDSLGICTFLYSPCASSCPLCKNNNPDNADFTTARMILVLDGKKCFLLTQENIGVVAKKYKRFSRVQELNKQLFSSSKSRKYFFYWDKSRFTKSKSYKIDVCKQIINKSTLEMHTSCFRYVQI